MNLNDKERMLLEDQRKHEQHCIQKYKDSANQAQDQQLKQLFNTYSQQEQQHLDTINQILSGTVPNTNQQGQGNKQQQANMNQLTAKSQNAGNNKDMLLCQDLLMAEKYVSDAYNSTIFEMSDTNIRKALNHIQKEEQEHGEGIYNYMKSNNMYH